MIEIEIGNFSRQPIRIGQPGIGIGSGITGDGARAAHGFTDRVRSPVTRAGRTPALAKIDRDRQTALAVMFQRFNFAQSHRDRQGAAKADGGFGGGSALRTRLGQNVSDQGFQMFP